MSGKDEDREIRLEIYKIHARTDLITKLASLIVKWGTLCFFIYSGADVLNAYAGETTLADVSFSFLFSENLQSFLAALFGTGGIFYGYRQSKLRRDVIEKMQPERIKLEKAADPKRSSSGLTKRGDTREGDE